MKVVNNGQDFKILHFIIQSGINYLGGDFVEVLQANPKELKRWNKLIREGIIVVG